MDDDLGVFLRRDSPHTRAIVLLVALHLGRASHTHAYAVAQEHM